MFLLAFHIVAVGAIVFVSAAMAYRMGLREGERRAARALEEAREAP